MKELQIHSEGLRCRWAFWSVCAASLLAGLSLCASARGEIIVDGDHSDDAAPTAYSFNTPSLRVTDLLAACDAAIAEKRWPKAFEALTQFGEQAESTLIRSGDLMLPAEDVIAERLASLPADGVQAFRVFNDATVANLLAQADAAADNGDLAGETAILRRIATHYFVATGADIACDRMAASHFEAGEFSAAATLWQRIIEQYPEPTIAKADLRLRRGLALVRVGNEQAVQTMLAALDKTPPAARQARLQGNAIDAAEHLRKLAAAPAPRGTLKDQNATLAGVEPRWQSRYRTPPATSPDRATSQLGGRVRQVDVVGLMDTGDVEDVAKYLVPAVAANDERVFINWMGKVAAFDRITGKLIWRTEKFVPSGGGMSPMSLHCDQLAVTPSLVFATHPTSRRTILNESTLVAYEAATGQQRWQAHLSDMKTFAVLSTPVVLGQAVYVVINNESNELMLLGVDIDTGQARTQTSLGMGVPQINWGQSMYLPVSLSVRDGILYIATNCGALLAVDAQASRVLRAAILGNPAVATGQQRMFGGYYSTEDAGRKHVQSRSALLSGDDALYVREFGSTELTCLDAQTLATRWTRLLGSGEYPIFTDADRLITWQNGAQGYDAATRRMLWSRRTPAVVGDSRPAIVGNMVASLDTNGLKFHRISDGKLMFSDPGVDETHTGGRVVLVGDLLLTISPQAVTAYDLKWADGPVEKQK